MERNIRLNNEKSILKQTQVKFMGHLIPNEGVQADKSKVEAILSIPAPTNIHGVKRFSEIIQHLSKFFPNLASDLQPIRELTKKDVDWNWYVECEQAFQKVKQKITETALLIYFDLEKELFLQVDSSKDGLGAVHLQDGKPIEYTSRALTSTERNWAQIEKTTLAVVFCLERSDQYMHMVERLIVVENDHKPLASILKKPLSQAPKRLQVLILRLYRYDVDFHYIEGSNFLLLALWAEPILLSLIPMSEWWWSTLWKENQIRESTATDESMQTPLDIIKEGWPEHLVKWDHTLTWETLLAIKMKLFWRAKK